MLPVECCPFRYQIEGDRGQKKMMIEDDAPEVSTFVCAALRVCFAGSEAGPQTIMPRKR